MKLNMKLGNLFDFSVDIGKKKADIEVSAKRLDTPVWKFLNMEVPQFHSDNHLDLPSKDQEAEVDKVAVDRPIDKNRISAFTKAAKADLAEESHPKPEQLAEKDDKRAVEKVEPLQETKFESLTKKKPTRKPKTKPLEKNSVLGKITPKGQVQNELEVNDQRIKNQFKISRD